LGPAAIGTDSAA